jgi:hypothetical protein
MGLTLGEIDRMVYLNIRAKGYSHEETINKFPEKIRGNVLEDLKKTPFELHFGIKPSSIFHIISCLFKKLKK